MSHTRKSPRYCPETALWEMTVQTKTVSQQGFTPDDENAKDWVSDRQEVFQNQYSFCFGRVAQLGEHLLCKHVFISPIVSR